MEQNLSDRAQAGRDKYVRRADLPLTNRGDAAAATWNFSGDELRPRRGRDMEIPRRQHHARLRYEMYDSTREWTKFEDPHTQYPYWYNNVTGLSTWEEPAVLVAARDNAEAEMTDANARKNRVALAESGVVF